MMKVRGTPASGKTVLAQLLAEHIYQQDESVHIIWIYGWPTKAERRNYRSYLQEKGWIEYAKTVFIFDEAQESYHDIELWTGFFKSMRAHRERRAIVLCSYGSPASRISFREIPLVVTDAQRVTLRHIDHKDHLPPVGLFFTLSEFNDLVTKNYPSPQFHFHSSFFDTLFRVTNGHVGAIQDFISIIIADDVSSFALKKMMV